MPPALRPIRIRSVRAPVRSRREHLLREAAMVRGSETLHAIFDASGRALACNEAMRRTLGSAAERFLDLFADEGERRRAAGALADGTSYRALGRLRVAEGGPWYRITGTWRIDPVSGRSALFVEAAPVSELREEAAHYRHLAETDALTGLLSRRAVLERLEGLCADPRARPVCLVLADLDRFKRVNDRFGHAAGDRVLVAFAHILPGLLRRDDLCGRLGGEEFLLVLPCTEVHAARAVAERICERLRARLAAAAQIADGPLTASFGVTRIEPGEEDPQVALARADMALYRAKTAGRARVEVSVAGQEGR